MAREHDFVKRSILGALAGLGGTFAMMAARSLSQRYAPRTMSKVREDPGKFVVEQAEQLLTPQQRVNMPRKVEERAAMLSHLCYGATFGWLYAVVRPEPAHPLVEGLIFGTGVWAIGYAGWLPAAGLTEPIWRQEPQRAIPEMTRHAVYGLATAAAYDAMHAHT